MRPSAGNDGSGAGAVTAFYLIGVLFLTTYGQLILKMRANAARQGVDGAHYVLAMIGDPLVWSGGAAAGAAALLWILAIRTLDLSLAYPFVAGTFVLVPLASHLFLGEPLTWNKMVGATVIVAGVAISAMKAG